ncbi:unnamed protein product [Jaminaea pallidilutea]
MDLDDIGNRISNLTFYDLKSAWTQAKNYALNVSEIEAKVNEATNDDPWGASSTLMQEIAGATNNFADFNEIMPAIFRNFMEREAREWRQIYKSLQLLEYIVKHGSERVVDDARSHLGTIKILRNFHYIDEAGKDQGLNVRNRAKELAELLSDVERIRMERRKARANRTKYQGASNTDFVPGSGGGRYGGFGSDSFNAGALSGSSGAGGYGAESTRRESFDEYDAGDDEDAAAGSKAPPRTSTASGRRQGGSAPAPPKKKAEAKVADLFSFDDEESAPAPAASAAKAAPADDFGDDFDDFQAAPSSSSKPAAQQQSASSAKKSNNDVFDFLGGESSGSNGAKATPAPSSAASRSSAALSPPMRPSMSTNASASSVPSISGTLTPQSRPSATNTSANKPTAPGSKPGASSGLSGFDDLWSSSSGSGGGGASNKAGMGKKTMADLAKEHSGKGVWASSTPGAPASSAQGGSSGGQKKQQDLFDLL